jgi:cytochrome c peroxidase
MQTWQRCASVAASVSLVAVVYSPKNTRLAIAQTTGAGQTVIVNQEANRSFGSADRARDDGREDRCDDRPCDAVARGRAAFNRRNLKSLGGNGRACADCHMPSEHFQLSPAAATERFERLLARREHNKHADDPLFRPVDADDFRVNGDNASDFSNLLENGLVRVTMPLPLNVKLIDPATGQPSDETSVDLWRAVMPVLNVAITGPDFTLPMWPPGAPRAPIMGQDPDGPNRQGGYQHDGRFRTLQEQARGALFAHAQVSVEPPTRMLDDLAAFQQTLFSSRRVKRLADAILSGSTFPDPDPKLNELEERGRTVFNHTRGGDRSSHRPVSQHPNRLSASRDGRLRAVSAPARAKRPHLPSHARRRHLSSRDHIRPGATAPDGPTGRPRRDGRHATPRNQQDCPVLPQQLRRNARGSPRPLRRLFQARGAVESAAKSAADSFIRWPRRRSRICDGG